MTSQSALDINYSSHERVRDLKDTIQFCLEDISMSFNRWGEDNVTGPGLYFGLLCGSTIRDYADPMGDNQWPVDECQDVLADVDSFYDTAHSVGQTRDGAIVVSVDGEIQEQMVRFRGSTDTPARTFSQHSTQYADWMGSRHMSAIDTSLRPEVVTTLTLSAENGRVTVFEGGEYDTTLREEIYQGW